VSVSLPSAGTEIHVRRGLIHPGSREFVLSHVTPPRSELTESITQPLFLIPVLSSDTFLQQSTYALGGGGGSGSFPFTRWIHEVRTLSQQSESEYGSRRAAYDLKKLRGKQIVRRIAKPQRYAPIPKGLQTMTALVVLRNKANKPLLAAAQRLRRPRGAQNPTPLDRHYEALRASMQGVLHELGVAA
jgi:hypothetical protein